MFCHLFRPSLSALNPRHTGQPIGKGEPKATGHLTTRLDDGNGTAVGRSLAQPCCSYHCCALAGNKAAGRGHGTPTLNLWTPGWFVERTQTGHPNIAALEAPLSGLE